MEAFFLVDDLLEVSNINSNAREDTSTNLQAHDVLGDMDDGDGAVDDDFDFSSMEEAFRKLYERLKCTTSMATILLMNLFVVYSVSNNFVNELLIVMHIHILLDENLLLENYYAVRALMKKLGLTYNSIYACPQSCMHL